ncbi:MAG: HAD family phosphatase [Bacteroidota bacterium]
MINPANKYKNIIFDLGGVLLNIDYSLATKAFSDLGLTDFDKLFSKAHQTKLFDLYEKGQISSEAFRDHVKSCFNTPIDDNTIDKAWNAMLLDFPPERLRLLQTLKTKQRIFLLSNTNDIHIQYINNYLQETFGIADLSGYFEKVYLSYKVGMRKPDAEIFELVLSENNLDPNETLFIDDSIQHIEGAKKLGIHTYWLDVKKESVMDLFEVAIA